MSFARAIILKTVRWVLWSSWALLGLWNALAIWYCFPLAPWANGLIAFSILALFAASFREHRRSPNSPARRGWRIAAGCISVLVMAWYVFLVRPLPPDEWAPEHARMPQVTIDGHLVHVRDVRNFHWRTPTDFTPGFYDRTYDVDKISRMYYVVAPLKSLDAVAHVMLCFAFSDGQAVTISVEGRRPKGVPYAFLPSLFRQFQLIYIIGDERDVIGLRGNVWGIPVRMYPARTTKDRMQAIFLDMVRRAHDLDERPEFYNLIFNNCMNNITYHLRRLGGRPLPSDLAVLLTGLSDRVAFQLGYFDTDLPFDLARRAFRVDEWMRTVPLDDQFSAGLRETLHRQEQELLQKAPPPTPR
ncbi:MAG: DUF4105 domain-containing protein [Phycisphaerales bacterium]